MGGVFFFYLRNVLKFWFLIGTDWDTRMNIEDSNWDSKAKKTQKNETSAFVGFFACWILYKKTPHRRSKPAGGAEKTH